MKIMNISLPETLKAFVDTQVQQRGYRTSSEYVRDLIRSDQVKQAEQQLAMSMLEGLESGDTIPVNEDYWNNKRAAIKLRLPSPNETPPHSPPGWSSPQSCRTVS